jgi:dihydroorotate dehydrogenase electron transfer subunit
MKLLRRWWVLPNEFNGKKLRIVEAAQIIDETPSIKTFRFLDKKEAKPGQFVMIWIPGIDEIPMSLSYLGIDKGVTVQNVGETTEAMHRMEVSDKFGIRGPYGTNFEIKGDKILMVAGGMGIAPILPAIEEAHQNNKEITLIYGARTSSELAFLERLNEICHRLEISTDDGSKGFHGFATELAKKVITEDKFDQLFTCGPEVMMKGVLDLALSEDIPLQASIERYMKCGLGICDSCTVDGYQVCKDGPIFSGDMLKKFKEFGKHKRDPCGRLERI